MGEACSHGRRLAVTTTECGMCESSVSRALKFIPFSMTSWFLLYSEEDFSTVLERLPVAKETVACGGKKS